MDDAANEPGRAKIPSISGLGHIGLRVYDLALMTAFYRDVLGLIQTDEDTGLVFLSAQPASEHHQVLLCAGRSVGDSAGLIQQISFRCASLDDVLAFYRRFVSAGVAIDMTVSHGNAVGIYFFDPEGNRCEVYWPTGLAAKQPFVDFLERRALDASPERLMEQIRERVAAYGATGFLDEAWRVRNVAGGRTDTARSDDSEASATPAPSLPSLTTSDRSTTQSPSLPANSSPTHSSIRSSRTP